MKKCSQCGSSKEASEFHVRKRSGDGLASECKSCWKEREKRRKSKITDEGRSQIPSQHELNCMFRYSEGELLSLITSRGRRANDRIGAMRKDGYLVTRVKGPNIPVHRIIWKMHYGSEPLVIDHINGNKTDNRIENLRSVTVKENVRNAKGRNASSGFIGVQDSFGYRSNPEYRWVAKIKNDGLTIRIGGYRNVMDAVLAYNAECERLHGEYGRRKIEHNLNKLREMGLM